MTRKFLWVASGFLVGAMMTIGLSAFSLKPRDTNTYAVSDLQNFVSTFEQIKEAYVKPVSDDQLLTNAISGMVSGLDPHSSYLDEEAFKELQVQTEGKFGGLGMEVSMDEDGFVRVIAPIEGTPADNAGVRAGDVITKIDDTAVRGMKLTEAVQLMRGKPKTKVTLTIARKVEGGQQILTLTLIRDIINVVSVKSKMLDPGYGYLRITQFQDTTLSMMVDQLNKLQRQTPLKGLILDLRNDPGGVLESAIGVSSAFLEKGQVVVSTDGRLAEAKDVMYASPEFYLSRKNPKDPLLELDPAFKQIPIIVLVNAGSASASEIVAGALQDHQRALVMGTKTFGKGSVQRLIPLNNKVGMKLTVALYFTPNKRSIQAEGIVPDVIVEDPSNPESGIREADLQHHLDQPGAAANREASSSTEGSTDSTAQTADEEKALRMSDSNIVCRPVDRKDADRDRFKFGDDNDYQMNQALSVLKQPSNFDKNGHPILTEINKKTAHKADKKKS